MKLNWGAAFFRLRAASYLLMLVVAVVVGWFEWRDARPTEEPWTEWQKAPIVAPTVEEMAAERNVDLVGARKAGYSDAEIAQHLAPVSTLPRTHGLFDDLIPPANELMVVRLRALLSVAGIFVLIVSVCEALAQLALWIVRGLWSAT